MSSAPNNPELIDLLAAEYVLGTLRGGARRRMERWRATGQLVDARCSFWEERLMPLFDGLSPVRPPRRVWERIQRQLQLPAVRRRHAPLAVALAAGLVLALALGLLWYWRELGTAHATQVATISAPVGTLLWEVEVYGRAGEVGRIKLQSGAQLRPGGHDYELWALPKFGSPVSLGVLPFDRGVTQHPLTPAQQRALVDSVKLAVSIEPPGGSPTGQPTGAVVFVASLRGAS